MSEKPTREQLILSAQAAATQNTAPSSGLKLERVPAAQQEPTVPTFFFDSHSERVARLNRQFQLKQ